jgi:predicted nuclease of predicted toxin-antitoxin system
MARLFADENFPLPTVEALRRLGHNVLTLHEAGKVQKSTPDNIVLEMASADGRAIVTLNRKHFVQLHA